MTIRSMLVLVSACFAGHAYAGLIQVTGFGTPGTATAVGSFKALLVGADNGTGPCAPSPCTNGFRVINWDAVPDAVASPNSFPADFFNGTAAPRARGAVFATPGTGFQVSANAGVAPVRFDNINPAYSATFTTFSPQRLFTSIGSNITDVQFAEPGNPGAQAFVKGFGSVFTDVDLAATTAIQFFDLSGASLGTVFAPPANNGLSFAGGFFDAGEKVGRVRITAGNTAVGPSDNNGSADVVVMDDFIYSEPARVPEPSSLLLSGIGILAAGVARRFRRI